MPTSLASRLYTSIDGPWLNLGHFGQEQLLYASLRLGFSVAPRDATFRLGLSDSAGDTRVLVCWRELMHVCHGFLLVMDVYWMFFSIACGYLIDHEIDSSFQAIERCSRANRRVCQCPHGPERASIELKCTYRARDMTLCKGWKKLESLFVAVLQLFQVSSALPLWISFLSSQQLS